ncbi:hypothetical protein [Virgibacillus halodenitrificans]|uniref:hypothetical protein n=1 Tax=Virgibacillus halodenitrificans TaxID=1482 RepID=UPI000EF4688C|nr:hypothetical protein [Virgibacillus halodenitrificans]
MKRIVIGALTGAFILGSATFVSAGVNQNGEEFFNFEQMRPYMEEMHPGLSTEQHQEMFNNCHGENGIMQNSDSEFEGMMNKF